MKGYPAPLFEKLFDEDREISFEKNPKKLLSLKELEQSIHYSLMSLLNTKKNIFWDAYKKVPFSYGVEVARAIYSEDDSQLAELERHIEEAIRSFEPRLINPNVHIMRSSNVNSLSATIDAELKVGTERVQLSFPIVLEA